MTQLHYSENPLMHLSEENAVLITDSNVAALYDITKFRHIIIQPGEDQKSRKQKAMIEDQLFEMGCGRDLHLIAFGGGVICDLVGFIAATFCRGVKLTLIPTTLIAMVDAAIGGKNGINTKFSKNSIGTIYEASDVWVDLGYLDTLFEREISDGMAEIIKHALIFDADDFSLLEEKNFSLPSMIRRSIQIKRDVVKKDAFESGYRRILNFGHTTGHALERASGYTISHGMGVFIGMIVAAKLSPITNEEYDRIFHLVAPYINIELPDYSRDIFEYTCLDKKACNCRPRFVLLERIGRVLPFGGAYAKEISEKEFEIAYMESVYAIRSYHRSFV